MSAESAAEERKLFDWEPFTCKNLEELANMAASFMAASADFTNEVRQLVMAVKKLMDKLSERVGEVAVEALGARAWTMELSQELCMNQGSVARTTQYL